MQNYELIKDARDTAAERDRLKALNSELLGVLDGLLAEYAAPDNAHGEISYDTMRRVMEIVAKAKGE